MMTDTQFQMLLQTLNAPRDSNLNVSSNSNNSATSQISAQGNFVKCSARFGGTDQESVDAFIDQVVTYKECSQVSDEIALRGISLLLQDRALLWWQGVRKNISTWDEALDALNDSFSRTLPPSDIFVEIFRSVQQENEPTELFLCKIRALLAQLPYSLPKEAELDIAYGLIHRKIKKRLLRSDISDFSDFSKRARAIELSLRQVQHVANPVPSAEQSVSQTVTTQKKSDKPRCSYCSIFGHVRENCNKLRNKQSRPPFTNSENVEKSPKNSDASESKALKCFGCGRIGFTRAKCPNCQPSKPNVNNSTPASVQQVDISTCTIERAYKPLVPISVNGIKSIGCADSGAQVSIAGYPLVKQLQSQNCKFTETTATFSYADGQPKQEHVLQTNVEICIQGKIVPICLTALPESRKTETLLGVDFLEKAGIVLNLVQKTWYFADDLKRVYPFVQQNDVEPGPHICEIQDQYLRPEEGSLLDLSQREVFSQLLQQNADLFRSDGGPPTDFATHHIRTVDCEPKSVPPYTLSGPKKAFLKKEIDRLLKEEIIEECESPWGSPVVLVPKPDGKFRLCVDYRKLNSVTISDSYPMARIDDLLQSAKSTSYMSTIDLQSGFWQIPVEEQDRDKTCFVTPFGTYRFRRMPFGLKNAPMTFSRLMDRFRSGLGDRSIFTYLDDILVLSESFEKHIEDITAVFDRLRLFNLRARREKCYFVRNSVKYLGHIISTNGISPDNSKVDAIVKMPNPSCTKHAASFVQTCSWFRRFIPNFSQLARPLTNLLKKGVIFKFGEEEQLAFQTLKEKLVSAPILIQADCNKPFVLRTDASSYAIGAVLMQGEGNDERPIEYASRLLTAAEKNYSTVEREALAVVWSTEKFRTYLEGTQVTISSDCQPLQWLFGLKSPSGRLARWALKLQGLNMTMSYTPGRINVIADNLSRPFCDHQEDASCGLCSVSIEMPSIGSTDFRTQQREDPEVQKIITALEENGLEAKRWLERGFIMANGVLYHFDQDFEIEEPQLVVPAQCRDQIMKDYHDSPSSGHPGIDRTFRKIRTKFYFSGMRKFITDYVQRCPECQRFKVSNVKPAGLLQTPTPAQRFEVLAVDLFGPLPQTKAGNKWILICEDQATKWIEIFPMVNATADACAKLLIDEVFLRYGTPRKLISDNGVQFISDVMQKVTFCFGIDTPFIPKYHAESNPVERKNRDMKTMLSILVQNDHQRWDEYIPSIRFAMNSTYTQATTYTPAFLSFAREMRDPHDNLYDFRKVVQAENFVPRITPYLQRLQDCLFDATQHVIREQDRRKAVADQHRRPAVFKKGDQVLLKPHVISSKEKGITNKFAPRRDGPHRITKEVSPTTYLLTTHDGQDLGRHHAKDLTLFISESSSRPTLPVIPKKRRGRPKKDHNQPSGGADPTSGGAVSHSSELDGGSPRRPRGRPRKLPTNLTV